MKRNPIENCVKGIVFTEESKQRILKGITDKKGYAYKSYFGRIGFGFVAAIMVSVLILASAILGNTNKIAITAYAMTQEGNEKSMVLSSNEEVTLMPAETPVGYGYIFEMDIPSDFSFGSRAIGTENDVFTVYQIENSIYWIPTQKIAGNIYNSENDKLLTDSFYGTNECEFEILIYDEKGEVSDSKIVEFKIINGECKVLLKKDLWEVIIDDNAYRYVEFWAGSGM